MTTRRKKQGIFEKWWSMWIFCDLWSLPYDICST